MRVATIVTILVLSGVFGCSPSSQSGSDPVVQNARRSNNAQPGTETDGRCIPYEPAVVEVRGRQATVTRYGPPNFGENPESDEKLDVPVLTLKDSARFCAEPDRPADTADIGVNQVQLNFTNYGDVPAGLLGREVLVTGTAMRAISGYHFTPVVLTVSSIRAAPDDNP